MSVIDLIYYEYLYMSLIDLIYYLNVNFDSCIITNKLHKILLKNDSTAKRACLGRSSVGQQ